MKFSEEESRILKDNISGSSEILQAALRHIMVRLNRKNVSRKDLDHLRAFARSVAGRFDSMKAVSEGMKEIGMTFRRCGNDRESIIRELSLFQEKRFGAEQTILINCERFFKKKVSVASYSNSGMIKTVLGHFRSRIRVVYLSESRPACEGKIMARFLSRNGIPVKYMVDMMLFEKLPEVDYLILGADTVSKSNFINKIGSRALLEYAGSWKIKRIVIFESAKLQMGGQKNLGYASADEVWNEKYKEIEVINRYFEVIPNSLVDYFISDKGISPPSKIARWIRKGR